MSRLDNLKKQFAEELYQCGAFKDRGKSPGGNGFQLHRHLTEPDAPLSPYYLDLAVLRSYPTGAKATAVDIFEEMIEPFDCEILADVPTAITPVVSSLSDRTEFPMITPKAPKSYGGGGDIDGVWSSGASVLLFDGVINRAGSILTAAKVLRAHGLYGLKVRDVFVLIDREEGGRNNLNAHGLLLHAALSVSELLRLYRDMDTIPLNIYEEIQAYRFAK
ncbi:MAG: hypothetical protein Q7R69_02720 [bacterium]|nr:hypothetical protein [bacterium]